MIEPKEQAAIAKRWLMRSIGAQRYSRALARRLESVTFANITRYENDGTSSDPQENKTEANMAKYADLCEKIERVQKVLAISDFETISIVDKMESNTEKAILINRYVNLMSWDEIGKAEGYSKSHIQWRHGKALLNLYKVLRREGLDEDISER